MSFGLNQTVEARQFVVEEFITAGQYAGDSFDKDLTLRAGDVEHDNNIKFSVFDGGELKDIASVTKFGFESERISTTSICSKDAISNLGRIDITHDEDAGDTGFCGQMSVKLNCGLSSGEAFVDVLKLTCDTVSTEGLLVSNELSTSGLYSSSLYVSSASHQPTQVATFQHPLCASEVVIDDRNGQLTLVGNIESEHAEISVADIGSMHASRGTVRSLNTSVVHFPSWTLEQ